MARITVEDCLEQVNNRFGLVILASKRAKQILSGSSSLNEEQKDNRAVVTALREVAERKVRFASDDEMAALEQAKLDAALEAEQESVTEDSGPSLDSIFSSDASGSSDSSGGENSELEQE